MGSEPIVLMAALLAWPIGFVFLARLMRRPPLLPQGVPPASLSIIIPARDEAHNLPALLKSIQSQACRPLEVIVVDDGSTDGTAAVARKLGATVLDSQPLPDGWRGKPWACHQGSRHARGEWLLFIDADTWLEPDGLAAIVSRFQGGALSVGPYHAVQQPYEQLSAFFNLVMVVGTLPKGLFGQMLLVDRASYERVGGHEAVKGNILENFRLARRFHEAGIPTRSLCGKGIIGFRMYPRGVGELIQGWTKGFASGAGNTPKGTLLLVIAWLAGMILPLSGAGWRGAWLGVPLAWWAVVVYGVYAAQLAVLLRRVGRFGWYTAVFYPVPLVFYYAVFGWSCLRSGRPVTWKGRAIRAD